MSNFKDWLNEVDSYIIAELGFSLHDVEDYTWRDWFEDKVSAQETASEYISDWKYDHSLLDPPDPISSCPDDTTALLAILFALNRFPCEYGLIPEYELAPLQHIERDTDRCGVYAFKLRKYNTYGVFDPAVNVWLVSRVVSKDPNTKTVWTWDSVDREWISKDWSIH